MDSPNRGWHGQQHPGFQSVQSSIQKKEGVSHAAAGRILGAASRNASPAAKKRNPRLNRVRGARRKLAAKLKF